jgi:hypothetical protein
MTLTVKYYCGPSTFLYHKPTPRSSIAGESNRNKEALVPEPKGSVEVRLSKAGPNGTPFAEILVDKKTSSAQIGSIIQRVTRDKDLLKKVGLKACGACKSGLDINIRDRFDHVLQVDLAEVAGGGR